MNPVPPVSRTQRMSEKNRGVAFGAARDGMHCPGSLCGAVALYNVASLRRAAAMRSGRKL